MTCLLGLDPARTTSTCGRSNVGGTSSALPEEEEDEEAKHGSKRRRAKGSDKRQQFIPSNRQTRFSTHTITPHLLQRVVVLER